MTFAKRIYYTGFADGWEHAHQICEVDPRSPAYKPLKAARALKKALEEEDDPKYSFWGIR